MAWRSLNLLSHFPSLREVTRSRLSGAGRALNGATSTAECERLRQSVETLTARLAALEHRLLNYHSNRWNAIDMLADYLVGAELPGDYAEFGVFAGDTFGYAIQAMARLFPKMNFVACDSFEGLPNPKGIDAEAGYRSSFYKGQFTCDEDKFFERLRLQQVDLARVRTIKGWFEQSLVPGNHAADRVEKVAAAWIDGDLYESTVPVLDFLTSRLSVGSVLLFDDWRCFRNLADFGEQRACGEWLARNPQITLNEFISFGFHGVAFTVATI
jgi:O-methyltransferase